VPAWLKSQAHAEYGITQYKTGDYEVHHLIPLSLGAPNSIRNLWPQTKTSPWNSYVKDALERKLHKLVCAGQLHLKTAQREIASDWIEAYKKSAGSTPSLVVVPIRSIVRRSFTPLLPFRMVAHTTTNARDPPSSLI
jgi:hypothetical protein